MIRVERDKVHSLAQNHQKPIIYIPIHVFIQATNARMIYRQEAIKQGKDVGKINEFLRMLASHLPKVQGWHEFMHNFAFVPVDQTSDSEESDMKESEDKSSTSKSIDDESEHKSVTLKPNDKKSQRPKPLGNTSNEMEPIAGTSEQSKTIADTSKHSEPIAGTSDQLESNKLQWSEPPTTPKRQFSRPKRAHPIASITNKENTATGASKMPEIVRKSKKNPGNEDKDEETTKDLEERQVFMI